MIRPLASAAAHALRDQRGVSIVELGFFAPVAALMIVGITDLARGYSEQVTLEQAVHRTLEKAAVGVVQTDYTFLKTEAAAAAGVSADKVVVDYWLECDRVRQPAFDGVCGDTQMISRYVSITINSSFKPVFKYGAFGAKLFSTASDGTAAISANAVVRVQ